MRSNLPTLLLVACLAAPLQAQTCKKVPPPLLSSLLPQQVAGMPLEFSTDPSGGCMSLYRPASAAARASEPWAVVTLEANTDEAVGEDTDKDRARFQAQGLTVLTMANWPVVFRLLAKGDEYVALMGSVKLTVLVKNGDQGPASQAMAARFFSVILPKIPCG